MNYLFFSNKIIDMDGMSYSLHPKNCFFKKMKSDALLIVRNGLIIPN